MDDLDFAELIIALVAQAAGLRVADLKGPGRVARFTRPRHVAQFLIREHTALSFNEIARLFTGRHHATVLVAHRQEKKRAEKKALLYLGGVSKNTDIWHAAILEKANAVRLEKTQKRLAADLRKVDEINAKNQN